MKLIKFGLACLLACSSLATIGCGKSEAQKAEDLITEHTAISNEVSSMGTPSTSWSEAKLNSYIAKLDRLSSLESQAKGNDYIISYGDNSRAIAHNRALAENALRRKHEQASIQSKTDKLMALLKERDALVEKFGKFRKSWPDTTWTDQKLKQAIADARRAEEISRQAITLFPEVLLEKDASDWIQKMKNGIAVFEVYREGAQRILNDRGQSSTGDAA